MFIGVPSSIKATNSDGDVHSVKYLMTLCLIFQELIIMLYLKFITQLVRYASYKDDESNP